MSRRELMIGADRIGNVAYRWYMLGVRIRQRPYFRALALARSRERWVPEFYRDHHYWAGFWGANENPETVEPMFDMDDTTPH